MSNNKIETPKIMRILTAGMNSKAVMNNSNSLIKITTSRIKSALKRIIR